MNEPRREVLWFGVEPERSISQEFENRRLALRVHDRNASLPPLGTVTGAIFSFEKGNNDEVACSAKTYARSLLDYGIRIDLIAPDDHWMGQVQKTLGQVVALPGVNVRTAPRPFEIAEGAARHSSGRRPRLDLQIVVADNREPIRSADAPLFQRAFPECKKIVLVELTGGISGARVFAVHMTVDKSNAGVWPQPAFAKLDRRDKIEKEFQNYRQFGDAFIPFGLRPNVKDVVVGTERSLLVGNFVDRSESLWDLARRNVAARAVTALVDETLGGWRDQAYAQEPIAGSVADAMARAGIISPLRIKSGYADFAESQNVHRRPGELWDNLAKLNQSYRRSPIHGDLHGENVRVHNGHAILIDFASVSHGPLTADLAALETWLAFQLPPDAAKDEFKNESWTAEVDRLYAPAAFSHPPGPSDPSSEHCWMGAIVRQIRRMGISIQSCPTEYGTAVAVQLLRRCQWNDGPAADRYRRGYGYVIAARLIEDIVRRTPSR